MTYNDGRDFGKPPRWRSCFLRGLVWLGIVVFMVLVFVLVTH